MISIPVIIGEEDWRPWEGFRHLRPSPLATTTRVLGGTHDQGPVHKHGSDCRSRGDVMHPACLKSGRKRSALRNGSFSDIVQRDGAAALRPRHAIPAFVLVSGIPWHIR